MPEEDIRKKRRGCAFGSCLVWFGLATTVSLLLIAIALYGQYRSADGLVQKELKRVREAGEPTDDTSMIEWFRSKTHAEGTQVWQEIIAKTQSLIQMTPNVRQLPIVGEGKLPHSWNPNGVWQEEPQVAQLLKSARPIFDLIEEASVHPTPVWFPIEFKGIGTVLPEIQRSREVARLLQLEFYHALYQRDKERAAKALRSMQLTADAFDWQTFAVTHLIHVALETMALDALGNSLDFDIWNEQELQDWMKRLEQPADVAQDWREILAGERYGFLSESTELDRGMNGTPVSIPNWLLQLPQTRRKFLRVIKDFQELGDGELGDLVTRSRLIEAQVEAELSRSQLSPANVALGLFMPGFSAIANTFEQQEDMRRMLRTALAIKLFQFRHGNWPSSLDELTSEGLTSNDWTTLKNGKFGYSIEDGQAWLWSYSTSGVAGNVPTTRPDPAREGESHIKVYRIR